MRTSARMARVPVALLGVLLLAVSLPATAQVPFVRDVALDPNAVPPQTTGNVAVTLVAKEVIAELAPGQNYYFWTFVKPNEKPTVPGPMIRVTEGYDIILTLRNELNNVEPHNIDFHAVMGPGGGAAVTNLEPGQEVTVRFKATRAGAYIYHCAGEGMPWEHVSHGMYGLIQVDPPKGLPSVDKEFYVGQSEWYLSAGASSQFEGKVINPGVTFFNLDEGEALAEHPDYFTLNGHTQALTDPALFGDAMSVNLGSSLTPKTIRIFFVTGGPNIGANFHIIGQIFDKVYTGHPSTPVLNEETVYVAPGSAAVFELTAMVPGKYLLVDHALWRVTKGAAGFLHVAPACTDPTTCAWPLNIYSPPATGTGH